MHSPKFQRQPERKPGKKQERKCDGGSHSLKVSLLFLGSFAFSNRNTPKNSIGIHTTVAGRVETPWAKENLTVSRPSW